MDTAFQSDAFQNDAFQIAAPAGIHGGIPFWLLQHQINANQQELDLQEAELAAALWWFINSEV